MDYKTRKSIKWLDKVNSYDKGFGQYELFMRKADDNRPDFIIKKEIFMEHINGKYYIEFVLDDRTQVVDMWRRELGLTVFQVNEGDF